MNDDRHPLPRIPSTLEEIVRPASTCLVVWDVQRGLAGRATNLDEIAPNIQGLIAAASEASVLVAWSRHVAPPLHLASPAAIHFQMRRQGVESVDELTPYMQRGMPQTEFLPGFEPAPDHLVIDKMVPSFFVGTPLDGYLRARRIMTLVLTGVATEIGIEFTGRHALALGYFVVVARDAVGSYTDESHRTGMDHVASFALTPSTEEIREAWPGSA